MSAQSEQVLQGLYLIAIVAEAMTAALSAGRRNMDWVGVYLLGCVTALGGGSVRDVLLGHYPLSWVQHPSYLLITGCAALATIAIARYMHRLRHVFLFLDAVGLVCFTVIGCNVAIGLGMPFTIVIASGLITGCVGGVLRDILCTDVPLLFRAELYATVSVATGVIYVAGQSTELSHSLVMLVAMLTGLAFRLLALRYKWSMPKFVYTHDLH
ncbi:MULTISPECIES: trimeric intracellular cation channel family protein [unclassified Chelatococcus]|uniref:trimeric intracellular cation channel family protein n=1 Tax=unclassified Chelatococcus TaxID=2638111 RepID=UPI00224BBDEB|nr:MULTISPECIES: trimeric intracellular cation channel family protein [unclassified Chelatococcus]CAH1652506.1 PF03458 family inner membrane protein YicG [Hyphomicrobiales bacterium]CAH1685970.1 PF03458 family inner membrane protein YicG [Hyphomicrobiales bacterium]